MKPTLIAAVLIALLTGPAAAQTPALDCDSYLDAGKRAAAVFAKLRPSEHRAWAIEVALRECGYPVPPGLHLSYDQLSKAIIDTATTRQQIDLTMHVLLALESWIAGYKVGIATALGDLTPDACRMALQDAEEVVALRR